MIALLIVALAVSRLATQSTTPTGRIDGDVLLSNQADQQNAWLNESVAEYTAMMALRNIRGQHAFTTVLDQKKTSSQGLPPVYGFDRTINPRQSPAVLYSKGPVLLSELETQLGSAAFAAFLRQAAAARVAQTDSLLDLLARVSSCEVANAFLQRLKQ